MPESEKHKQIIKELSLKLNGEIVIVNKRLNPNIPNPKRDKYYPDLKTETTDYEVIHIQKERLILEKKSLKWDKTRKKVIILTISDEDLNLFNEAYIYENGIFIKIK